MTSFLRCVPVSVLIVFIGHVSVVARYNFSNIEEGEICRQLKLVEITPYRAVSSVPMDWISADLCCKMKGRILHTIERMDEFRKFPLRKVLLQRIEDADISRFWIGLSLRDDEYRWIYGTKLWESYRLSSMKEKYKWASGDLNSKPKCVGIAPKNASIEMHTLSCSLKLPFICQKIQKPIDEPLSGHDLMVIGSAEFQAVDEFSNLKFSKAYGGWSLAKAICQARNWALIDHVHEHYGEKLFLEIANKEFMFAKSSTAIHTAANDICEHERWQWNCGQDILGNSIPWSRSHSRDIRQTNNDDIDPGKRCIQYFLEAPRNNESSARMLAKSVICSDEAYIICDTNPECEVSQQLPCLHKDPHYINIDESLDEDMKMCSTVDFQKWSVPGSSGVQYWISGTKFTWAGAKKCCESKGWKLPAPTNWEEMEFLVENTLGVASSALCRNELECDGIWTSTSTMGYSPFSPLRFPGGRVLKKKLYSSTRADGFTHPSCGRINYVSFRSGNAKYFHAYCLEKNFLVCETTYTYTPQERKTFVRSIPSDKTPGNESESEELKTIRFNRTLHDYFNSSLNSLQLSSWGWGLRSEKCLGNISHVEQNYSDACPNSASTIFAIPNEKKMSTQEAHISLEFQNRFLLDVLSDTLYGPRLSTAPDAMPSTETQAFTLLNSISMIYSQLCPIVPAKFIRKMFRIFKELYFRINPTFVKQPDMMSKENFRWTLELLSDCQQLVKPVVLKHDQCGDVIVGKQSCSNFICTNPNFEFNIFKTDLIVDFMWKIFELTHAACFPAFQVNPMLHHKFAMSVVDIWESKDLRLRWVYQLADKKFWVRLLGPNFESSFINMERCNEAIINDQNTMFHVRLPRGAIPASARIKGFPYEELNRGFKMKD